MSPGILFRSHVTEALLLCSMRPSAHADCYCAKSGPGASQYQETLLSSTIVPSKSEGDSTVGKCFYLCLRVLCKILLIKTR